MDARLYNKTIACPVCMKEFQVTKVKSNASKISSIDTDFCIYYEGINPFLYDVWVCEHCGYAAQSEKFDKITLKDSKLIISSITPKWSQRSFSGERTIEQALETFKLALINLDARKGKPSEYAKICLRIAWLYRLMGDPREIDFLKYTAENYTKAFQTERFPLDKLDENTCMYTIAELNRRIGNYEEAAKWFSSIISSPDARHNAKILEKTRDQYQLTKEALEKEKPVENSQEE